MRINPKPYNHLPPAPARHWGVSNETTYGICQLCETAKRLGVPLPISIQVDPRTKP